MLNSRRRRILAAAAAIVGIAVVTTLVLLLPPVQTAIARRLTSDLQGARVSLGGISAGPWGATVHDLRVEVPGVTVATERVDVDLAFWSSLLGLRLDLESVVARGVDLEVAPVASSADAGDAGPTSPPFRGLGQLARLPERVEVRALTARGRLRVSEGGGVEVGGPWTLSAAAVGPGRASEGSLHGTLEVQRSGAPLLAAAFDGAVTLRSGSDGRVRSVEALLATRTTDEADPIGVDTAVTIGFTDSEERYAVTVDGSDGERLLELEARLTPDAGTLASTWTARAPPGLIAAFARNRTLPDLWGRSTGSATISLATGQLDVEALATVEARDWARVDEALAEVDDLTLDAEVAGSLDSGRLEARRLRVALTSADREVLRLVALHPVSVDLDEWRITPEVWGEPAVRMEADGFPLRWTRGFDPGVMVEQGTLSASLDIVPVEPGRARLEAHRPIRATGLRLRPATGSAEVPPVDVVLVPRLEIGHGTLEAEVERLELSAPTGLRFRFRGLASTARDRLPAVDLDGEVELELPRLQHALESLDVVRGGARFHFDLERSTLAVDAAELDLVTTAGASMVSVRFENEVPLTLPLPSLRPDWESVTPQELRLRFDSLPIGWVSPFIPEIDLAGGSIHGELVAVTGTGRGLALESAEPFQVRDLEPVYRGRPLTRGAMFTARPTLQLDRAGARLALEEIGVRTANGGRVDGSWTLVSADDGRHRIVSTMTLEGEFPSVTDRIGRIGALRFEHRAEVDLASRRIEVTDVRLGLTDKAGTDFLEIAGVRPFVVTVEPFGVWVDSGSPDILIATVTPLELRQVFPDVLGLKLDGALPQGQFVGRAEDGRLVLAAEDPLLFRDVTVRWEEATLLDRVSIGLQYEVSYSAGGFEARSIDFSTFAPDGAPIADATFRAVMPLSDSSPIDSLAFEGRANLQALARQPIFAGLPTFRDGTVTWTLESTFGDASSVAASIGLTGARADGFGALPDLSAGLDLRAVSGRGLRVRAPLTMTSDAGTSDAVLVAELAREDERLRFDAALTGDRVVAADLKRFVQFAGPTRDDDVSAEGPADARARSRPSRTAVAKLRERRDESPFWTDRVTGTATVDFGRIDLTTSSVLDVHGTLDVDPRRILLGEVAADMLGAALRSHGRLSFDPSAARPYNLELSSTVTDLEVGRLFREVAPDVPPTLEGAFEMRMDVAGTGRNLLDLGMQTLGGFRLSGRDGVFRGLAGRFGLARTGAKVGGVLLFSKELRAIGRLLGELEELEFDTFDLVLARPEPQRFEVATLEVVSPLAHIEGSGGIDVDPDTPLPGSPLDVRLELGTRGDLTILFDGMGLLESGEDALGYRPLTRVVTVSGTVAEPDTSDFYEMLDEAAENSGGAFGFGLRRVNRILSKKR